MAGVVVGGIDGACKGAWLGLEATEGEEEDTQDNAGMGGMIIGGIIGAINGGIKGISGLMEQSES